MFLLPFHVVGCSHESSAAEQVGGVRLSPERTGDMLTTLREQQVDAVLVSTCHRTELYWWGEAELAPWFSHQVLSQSSTALRVERADADLAVRHLFAVAAGMKSARYGEPEILGQVRQAWTTARNVGTSRGALDGTFRHAIDAARHIRVAMGGDADPALGERVHARLAAFVNAQAEAQARVHADAERSLLIVGSGDAARGVLEALKRQPLERTVVRITNRTDARAQAAATEYGLEVVPWETRHAAIAQACMVVFAIQVTSPLIGGDEVETLQSLCASAKLWVDLGVPGAVSDDALVQSAQDTLLQIVSLAALEERSAPAIADARARRAGSALQLELDRFARATHRIQLGARLGALEERAIAVAAEHGDGSADELARRVTRLVLRELTRA
ncbi:MAG: hypothetical protein IBJ03_05355 [Gemmatimonadaceae bacterium]|nr:hypothetical protein [Gemmatimonadaceae bacterium]